MIDPSPDSLARSVCGLFPVVARHANLVSLGNHGGFSGAQLWRVDDAGSSFCLRAWPADTSRQRLLLIHECMRRARSAGLDFVPLVYDSAGSTFIERAGRLWELTSWMPGQADYHDAPNDAHLQAACAALALVHRVWRVDSPVRGPCPAIARRLKQAAEWDDMVASGWRPLFAAHEEPTLRHWAERAWLAARRRIASVPGKLAPWTDQPFVLQPCLCDVWHDHVLFTGNRVSGLIDYGAIKTDHVSVDLARLLGSLVGDDAERWSVGRRSYGMIHSLSPQEETLGRALDQTGAVLALATWLKWLYRDGKGFDDQAAVVRHLAELVMRVEAMD